MQSPDADDLTTGAQSGDALGAGVSGGEPTRAGEPVADIIARQAKAHLKSLVSDDSLLPSLGTIADDIRVQLAESGEVAILYVTLGCYGRLESLFGWQIVDDILAALARNLSHMVGGTLRALDVLADFTLSDNAFVVVLSPPRSGQPISAEDLLLIRRRVSERLQGTLLNDLAPGVYDRVRPFVGAAVIYQDEALTFEQNLQRGVALAMEAAEREAVSYDTSLQATLAELVSGEGLEALYQPLVDAQRGLIVGYHATVRGPFYSPLRLPDVLADVAARSSLLSEFGIAARQAAVAGAHGLAPEHVLILGSRVSEMPNAAVVALSEFYSLNTNLVPQHVVFELATSELAENAAAALRVLSSVREMGFQLCCADLGAEFTVLDLVARARPDFLSLDPLIVARSAVDPTMIDTVQLLLRFAARIDAQLIAPNVTSEEQFAALRGVGVGLFRGEFFAHPDTHLPKVPIERLGL